MSDLINPKLLANLTTKKVRRIKKKGRHPSDYRQRTLKDHIGVKVQYGYFWAVYKGKILHKNGFFHPLLAVHFRNQYLIQELGESIAKKLPKVNQKDLALFKIAQQAVEQTQDYKTKHIQIELESKKRSLQSLKNKAKGKFIDYFADL